MAKKKKRLLYSCIGCGRITSTTNKGYLDIAVCRKCRRSMMG